MSSTSEGRSARNLTSVGELLREQQPELIISRQKLEQARGIELVRIRREQQNQDLPKDQLLYEGRNGQFILQIAGHPEFGVPFGQDRLVPIFQKSRTIRFRTAAEMLESFGMDKEYRRLVAAFERIFGATIYFGTDSFTGTANWCIVPALTS